LYLRGIGTKETLPTYETLNPKDYPDLFAIGGVQKLIGPEQTKERKKVKTFLDVLQKGPYNFEDALNMGLIDGAGYHQDLLDSLANDGIKIWSLRKYCDAKVVHSYLGDLDTDSMLIPQMFRGKKASKEKERKQKEAERAAQGIIQLLAPSESCPVEDLIISIKVILPRTVGLIYLDRDIER
jgi:hypothetical protein